MASKTRTEADLISYLLLCVDCNEGKIDWNEVAKRSGLYKAGKYSSASIIHPGFNHHADTLSRKQAFDTIKKKYPLPDADTNEQGAPIAKPVKTEKRKAGEDVDENGNGEMKTKGKKQVKVEKEANADGDGDEEPKPAKKKQARAKPNTTKKAIKAEESDSTEGYTA